MVDRILHNLSLLLGRSFATVHELNRYRKELGRDPEQELAARSASASLPLPKPV